MLGVDEKSQVPAAKDVASGATIRTCFRPAPASRVPTVLNQIEENLPAGRDVHLVMFNSGAALAKICAWLARHPRYHVHFTELAQTSWIAFSQK